MAEWSAYDKVGRKGVTMNFTEMQQQKEEGVARKTGLTPEEIKVLERAMNATWNYVGSDFLEACIGQGSGKSIPRSHVVEAVTDADRMETFNPKDRDVIKKYYALDDKKKKLVDKLAFPFERYGW